MRVGLLLDSSKLIAPFAACIDHINRCDFATISLVLYNGSARAAHLPLNGFLTRHSRYVQWDMQRRPEAMAVLREVDCSDALKDVEAITCSPEPEKDAKRLKPQDVQKLDQYNLDVLVQFGFGGLTGEALRTPKYGTWRYRFGERGLGLDGPAHFWEMVEERPTSEVALEVAGDHPADGFVLDRLLAGTNVSLSHLSNMMGPFAGGATMLIRALHRLHENGWPYLEARGFPQEPHRGERRVYGHPTGAELLRFAAPKAIRILLRRITGPEVFHWRIAIRRSSNSDSIPESLAGFRWIDSPRGHYYADPFLQAHKGRLYLFVEDYLYEESRGRLTCAEVSQDGTLGAMQPVLEKPYHLSYPFVFEHAGEMFMIPETEANRTIELYRAVEFPLTWTREKVLFDGPGLDTTLYIGDGAYWFFTTFFNSPSANQLFLFSSHSLTGDWKFHPQNPLCKDVRYARNSGKLFQSAGRLIRPNQDCSVRYGYALHFHQVKTLDQNEYAEERLTSILPAENLGLLGVHTYNRAGGFEVIDGVRQESRRKHA